MANEIQIYRDTEKNRFWVRQNGGEWTLYGRPEPIVLAPRYLQEPLFDTVAIFYGRGHPDKHQGDENDAQN